MKSYILTIESDGGFAIPPEVLKELGIGIGDEILFEVKDEKLYLTKIEINTDK